VEIGNAFAIDQHVGVYCSARSAERQPCSRRRYVAVKPSLAAFEKPTRLGRPSAAVSSGATRQGKGSVHPEMTQLGHVSRPSAC
jgi:hypothetical protein